MLVWCTGISGTGRTRYAHETQAFCEQSGKRCRVIDIGLLLEQIPEHLRIGRTPTALLDGNEEVLRLHRAFALEALMREIEASSDELVLISTHACFMRRSRVMPALEMNFIKQKLAGRIDVFVTVIHDCHDVWLELQTRPEWANHLSLAQVAVWRDIEIVLTRMLAEYEGRPFYLLARSDPASALAQLSWEPRMPSLYLSYPITAIQKEKPELLVEAKALADRLRSAGFVVFDPMSIKDVPGTRQASGTETAIPPPMEIEAAPYLNSQTVSRDLQLIDQADMVVVYYPTNFVSPGVFTEMSHARDRRKPLYLCAFPGAPSSVSPFLGLFYTEAFATTDELIAALPSRSAARVSNVSWAN